MDAYELVSPVTLKPCGVFVCGRCNLVTPRDLVDRCCRSCTCGAKSRNRFEAKCSDCARMEYQLRMQKKLDEATEIEWDGKMMLFSEDISGSRDGWFSCPDEIMEEIEELEADNEDFIRPEFVFASQAHVRQLDLSRMVEQMTEDTYEDAGDNISSHDYLELQAAVDKFNAANAITYYTQDYTKKIRIPG